MVFSKNGVTRNGGKKILLSVVCSFDYVDDGEEAPLSHVLVNLWIVRKVTTIVA